MELSERCIKTLEREGFVHIFEDQDAPLAIYPEHTHQDKVTVFITEGSFDVAVKNEIISLRAGDRFNFTPHVPYSAAVGPQGCQFVVGEMIDGDF